MSKDTKIILGVILLVAIVLIAVGYAAITNITLSINGTASATTSQENFKVIFTGTPTSSGKGTATGTIDASDPTKATINVSGLTAKGDTASVTYTIINNSLDLAATLQTPTITVENETDFKVTTDFTPSSLMPTGTKEITITVELLTTPINTTPTTTILIELDATPVQS